MTWVRASVSEKAKLQRLQKIKFQKLQTDLQKDNEIKNYSQKKGKDLKKGNIIDNNETLHKVLQLKLINYLLEDESKFEIYDNTLLKKINEFCTDTQITKNITNKIYEQYENLKKEIKKLKNNAKKSAWVRAYPNKLKKQAVNLLGNHRELAKTKSSTLKTMAEQNLLTVPDFRKILKFKLSNYLGERAEEAYNKVYNKMKSLFIDGVEEILYKKFKFDKNKRNKQINQIHNGYKMIKKTLLEEKEFVLSEKSGQTIKTIKRKLCEYENFKKEYLEIKLTKQNLFKQAAAARTTRRKWVNDIKFAPHIINNKDVCQKIEERLSEDFFSKKQPDTNESEKEGLHRGIFYLFKLLKNNINVDNVWPPLYNYCIFINYINESKMIPPYDKELFITEKVKNDILTLSRNYLPLKLKIKNDLDRGLEKWNKKVEQLKKNSHSKKV